MNIIWDEAKNDRLVATRRISFQEIAELILHEEYQAILEHKSRPGQMIFIVPFNGYTLVVPFVIDRDQNIVLKTAFPSRKFHKLYGAQSDEKEPG